MSLMEEDAAYARTAASAAQTPPNAYTMHAAQTESRLTGSLTDSIISGAQSPFMFQGLAIAKAATSFYNSALEIGRFATDKVGADGVSSALQGAKIDDFQSTVGDLYGKSWASFYGDHARYIDFGADVVSLGVPTSLTFKLFGAAAKGEAGLLNVLGSAERLKEKYTAAARAATNSYGFYNDTWKLTRKAYLVGGASALAENTAAMAVTYASLNDSRMFDDYSLKNFAFDSIGFGAIGAGFKALQLKGAARGYISEFEKEYQSANSFHGVNKEGDPAVEIVRMIQSRVGKQFTDASAERYYKASLTEQFEKLPGLDKDASLKESMRPLIVRMVENVGKNPDEAFAMAQNLAGVKLFAKVGVDQTFTQQALQFLEKEGAVKRLSDSVNPDASNDITVIFGKGDKNNFVQRGEKRKRIPISNEKARELSDRLGVNAQQIDDNANIVLRLDARDIWYRGDVFQPNDMFFARTKADLQNMRLRGRTTFEGEQETGAALYLESIGNNPTSFLDLQTGAVLDDFVPHAGDMGYKLLLNGTKAVAPGSEVTIKDLLGHNQDLTQLRAHEADMAHIMATNLGKAGVEELEKIFKIKGVNANKRLLLPGTDAAQRYNYAFHDTNLLELETAEIHAAKGNQFAPLVSENGDVALVPLKQIQEKLLRAKDEITAKLVGRGYSLDEAAVYANSVGTKEGTISLKNPYEERSLTDSLLPRFAQVQYDLKGMPDRKAMQAALTQENWKEAEVARWTETVGKAFAEDGNWESIIAQKGMGGFNVDNVTSQEGLAAFARFAHGTNSFESNFITRMGSFTRELATNLKKKWVPQVQLATARIKQSDFELGKLNLYANFIKSKPNGLRIVKDEAGKYRWLDMESNQLVKDTQNKDTLMEISPIQGQTLELLQEKIFPDFIKRHNSFVDHTGHGVKIREGSLYWPPSKGQYFRVAKFIDGGKAMINARSESELAAKIKTFKDEYPQAELYTKFDIGNEKKAQGLFNRDDFFQDVQANLAMQRAGYAHDAQVGIGQQSIQELESFLENAAEGMARRSVSELMAPELRGLEQAQEAYDAVRGTKGKLSLAQIKKDQPFKDAINTILDRSLQYDYPLFSSLNNITSVVAARSAELAINGIREARATVFGKAPTDVAATTGKLPLSEKAQAFAAGRAASFAQSKDALSLSEMSRLYGFGADYSQASTNLALSRFNNTATAQSIISATNHFFVQFQLAKDVWNTAINLLSFTMTTLPEAGALVRDIRAGKIKDASFGIGIPGSPDQDFSILKKLGEIGKEFFNPPQYKAEWERMVKNGTVSNNMYEYQMSAHDYMREVGRNAAGKNGGDIGPLKNAWYKFMEGSEKLLVRKPNEFLRYAAGRLSEDLLMAAGVPKEVAAVRASQFVKRTQHNFPFAQRPLVFGGPVGSAISLYQTFVFNTVQNLARYAEKGDKAAIASFFAIQGTTFGLQSNPLFHAVNNYIAYRDGNEHREDIYGKVASLPEGDWLLYGGASNLLGTSLWARGDLTPRNIGILPTSLSEIPTVAQSIKVAQAISGFIRQAAGGEVPLSTAFGLAVQHSALSRPLAGIAAALQGESVDAANSKIADTKFFEFATITRAFGGRPFDEGKLVDLNYRINGYKSKDKALVAQVFNDIKADVYGKGTLSGDRIQGALKDYLRAGGEVPEFKNELKRTILKTDQPLAQRLAQRFDTDPDVKPWMDFLVQESYGQ